jgi:hypothetical protein
MMAKLQVIIDDELMAKAKMHAAQNGISLKDLVSDLLSKHLSTTSTTNIKESNDTSTTNIITEERVAEMIRDALVQFKESNDTCIKESNDEIIIKDEKETIPIIEPEAVSSELNWGNNEDEFYYETRVDEDGNEYQIRLVKPEALYGKIPPAGTQFLEGYDPEDPIEKMIREQEEKYGKKR